MAIILTFRPPKHSEPLSGSAIAESRRQAKKALTALDRLNAGAIDPRVVAVANLDGWLSGRAAFGDLDKPNLVILAENTVFTGAVTTPVP
jgi:hypothetical protein